MNSGFFLLDKPVNRTSFALIRELRKNTGIRKIGHTGTLDPFATGLLILCLGKATRLSSLLLGEDKEYLAEMELGTKTDTGDITGEIIARERIPRLDEKIVAEAAKKMLQITGQIPPRYSAVKISGKPAYKLARKGEAFDLPEKSIKIYSFDICSVGEKTITYRTKVSKGTYVRTLSEEFAGMLGSVGYTRALRRTAIGKLRIEEAVSPEKIDENNWQDYLKPVRDILSDYPQLILEEKASIAFLHGRRIEIDRQDGAQGILVFGSNDNSKGEGGVFLGWGIVRGGILHPKIVTGNSR